MEPVPRRCRSCQTPRCRWRSSCTGRRPRHSPKTCGLALGRRLSFRRTKTPWLDRLRRPLWGTFRLETSRRTADPQSSSSSDSTVLCSCNCRCGESRPGWRPPGTVNKVKMQIRWCKRRHLWATCREDCACSWSYRCKRKIRHPLWTAGRWVVRFHRRVLRGRRTVGHWRATPRTGLLPLVTIEYR